MKKLKVISLFCGCGGLDLWFKKEGYKILWANDINIDSCKTYELNIGKHIVNNDIKNIDFSRNYFQKMKIDVLLGGYPCQGFSISNSKRSKNDKCNFLYK